MHTKGPWTVAIDDQSGIGRTHSVYICTDAGWPEGQLARVDVQDGLNEREANARLIAAAPDLLQICQRVMERGYVSSSIAEEREDHDALAAAIARATGAGA